MKQEPALVKGLQEKVEFFYKLLEESLEASENESKRTKLKDLVKVTSTHCVSPIVVIRLNEKTELTREEQVDVMNSVASECLEKGIFVVSTGSHIYHHLHRVPPPSLRLTIMAKQSKEDIELALDVLKQAIFNHLG